MSCAVVSVGVIIWKFESNFRIEVGFVEQDDVNFVVLYELENLQFFIAKALAIPV